MEVLVEHSCTIYGSEGDRVEVAPHEPESGLYRITYNDGDNPGITILLWPDTALALSSALTRIVSLNAKANP